MKKSRYFKIFGSATLASAVTIGLSSCAIPYQSSGVFQTYSPTDILADNNSPLNSAFSNSPISTYAQSALYNLVSYQTVGEFSFDSQGNTQSTTKDFLTLDGAKAVIVFKDDTTAKAIGEYLKSKESQFDVSLENSNWNDSTYNNVIDALKNTISVTTTTNGNSSATTYNEGTDYWVFQRSKGILQLQNKLSESPLEPTSSGVTTNTQTDYL
ncbi:putative lipoprotein [Malacoplasma penetrans HF-2]|uniref:Lipoprotein n=1 Tax=Malacoplasma penetrans (strain HF-2) TaxID=272633 RepID=Q8EV09_MALP2|nr:putative lipoprotein [Malacoplasma penetrans HF-2]